MNEMLKFRFFRIFQEGFGFLEFFRNFICGDSDYPN